MTEEITARFLDRLWQLQEQAGLTNAALARLLGCDASYIRHLKAGRRRRLGLNIALAATRRFPELLVFLLTEELPVSNTDVPRGNAEEDTTP